LGSVQCGIGHDRLRLAAWCAGSNRQLRLRSAALALALNIAQSDNCAHPWAALSAASHNHDVALIRSIDADIADIEAEAARPASRPPRARSSQADRAVGSADASGLRPGPPRPAVRRRVRVTTQVETRDRSASRSESAASSRGERSRSAASSRNRRSQSPSRGRQSRSPARRSSPSAARSRGSRSPSAARDHGGRIPAPTIGIEVARPAVIISRPSGGGSEPVRVCRLTEASTNYGPDGVPPRRGAVPSASAFLDRGVSVDICRRYNSGLCTNEDCVRAHRCYHCLGQDHFSGDCQVPFDTCADILAENIRSGGMQARGRGGKGGRGHRG
jgi:hypothetical protein